MGKELLETTAAVEPILVPWNFKGELGITYQPSDVPNKDGFYTSSVEFPRGFPGKLRHVSGFASLGEVTLKTDRIPVYVGHVEGEYLDSTKDIKLEWKSLDTLQNWVRIGGIDCALTLAALAKFICMSHHTD
jgi:hypothetical protein